MSQATVQESTPRSSGRAGRVLATIFGILLVLAGAIALLWTVGRSTETFSEEFEGTVERVVIDVNGRVSLEAGEPSRVTVEREWLLVGAPEVEIRQDGTTLRISAECGLLQLGCMTHVTATAPAGAEVEVETAAGNVEAAGFRSGVDLTTSAGNVVVSGIAGPATLRSSAGRIEGDITDGDVDAETSAGRIDLDVRGDFSRISAVTSAGNVALTVPDDVYRVDADTAAGSVEVNVATDPDVSREIVARSSAGSIRIDRSPE